MRSVPLRMSLIILLALPAVAFAGGARLSVTVIPLPARQVTPPVADSIYAMLARHIRRLYRARVVGGRAVGRAVWGEVGSGVEEQRSRFLALVEGIKKSYKLLQVDRALKLARQADALLDTCGPEVSDSQPLDDLYLFSGLARLAQGQARQAAERFRRLVELNADFRLSPDDFPPDQVQAFERVRRRVLAGRRYPVEIVSRPAGARVVVNGVPRGQTPLRLELPPGPQYLRLELEDYSPWTLVLPEGPAPGQVRALLVPRWSGDPPLDLMSKAIAAEQLDEAQLAVLRLLAGFYQSDAVILVSLSRQGRNLHLGFRIFVVRPETVTRARLFNLGPDRSRYDAKLLGVATTMEALKRATASGLATGLGEPVMPVAPGPATPVRPPPRQPDGGHGRGEGGPAWYRSWWFWTAVGVAVAGAGAGLAVWLTRPEATWTLVVQPR